MYSYATNKIFNLFSFGNVILFWNVFFLSRNQIRIQKSESLTFSWFHRIYKLLYFCHYTTLNTNKVVYMVDVRGWRMQILNLEVALTRIHVILTHALRANTVFLLGKCAFPCFIKHAHSSSVVSSCLLRLAVFHYKFLYALCKVGCEDISDHVRDHGNEGMGSPRCFCLVEGQ